MVWWPSGTVVEDDVDELEEEVVWPCFRFDIVVVG